MSRLVAVETALPAHVHPQHEITAGLGPLLAPSPARRELLDRLHAASGVRQRHLVLPLPSYADLTTFGAANDHFLTLGTELAAEAVTRALDAAGLAPTDIDLLLVTSVTGVGAPSVDALLVGRLGLRTDVRRMPSFGLGCAGGAAGLARMHDYLVGHPGDVAVLVCLELCSLTLQAGDDSTASLVSSAIFGDGAAAAVLVGADRPASDRRSARRLPDVVDSASRLLPGTSGHLGWRIGGSGFRIVLAPGVPRVIEEHLGAEVDGLLAQHGLSVADVGAWVVHAGGPKVLDAVEAALGLPPVALSASRTSLAEVGNLSSASVLHVLHVLTARGDPPPGSVGVLVAFGPGISCDLVLLRWPED